MSDPQAAPHGDGFGDGRLAGSETPGQDGEPRETGAVETSEDPPKPVGRLIVITGPMGPGCHHLAWAMAHRLDQSVVVDGPILAGMVASEHASAAEELGTIRTALLRYCAQIALAETYRRAGYDVLIVEDLPGQRLADFRDLSDPDDVHLVVLDGTTQTYPHGLHVTSQEDVGSLAADVLARLDEALLRANP